MKKLCATLTAGLMLVATAWVGGSGIAQADYQFDKDALCGTDVMDVCTITIRNNETYALTEGVDSAIVDVVGKPGVTAKLQMYALIPSGIVNDWAGVDAYGTAKSFTTDGAGKATVTMPISVLTAPHDAGSHISFQLAGSTHESTTDQPIANSDGTKTPDTTLVRSARAVDINWTPVIREGDLRAMAEGAITGEVYGVQIRIKGTWTDISDLTPGNGRVSAEGYAVVDAWVSEIPDGTYDMRVFNRTRGIYDLRLGYAQGKVVLEKDIYITRGEHLKNGRKWSTTCEPYSATERCRTEIWATTVNNHGGKLVKETGWAFNNLTYKTSQRELWKTNPLGNTGKYTIDGRKWRTECDTPVTGRNGCRSYITATVVDSYRSAGTWKYRLVTKEVFNNMVRFAN